MMSLKKVAFLFAFVSSLSFVACGDSGSTSAEDVGSSSSDSEKFIELSSSELNDSLSSSSSEEKIESSSSSVEEESSSSRERLLWPSDSLKTALGGDYVPALTTDDELVDFHFERHNIAYHDGFQYAVWSTRNLEDYGYTDSLKASNFEVTADSAYFGKFVDHKIIIMRYEGGKSQVDIKYYDLNAAEFPAETFNAKNRGVELPEIKAEAFYFDSLENALVVAGTEENFAQTYIDSLKARGFKTENDTVFEMEDIEGKYTISVRIDGFGFANAYEIKFRYRDLSNYAYYRMPENFKVTYYEQSPSVYVQQNTFYRDGVDYYYTSSLKYTSTVSFESNSSYRFKYDEASGTWLRYEKERLRDTLSQLEFVRSITDYAGLLGQWNIFETGVEGFTDQGVVNYKVTTNVSGLECHKWTSEGYSDTIEKIICSADGSDYLLSKKNSSSSKTIGISEFQIGGVEVPAESP